MIDNEDRMKETEFVIIVPAYNAEEHLERCIRSVTLQNYRHFMLVITDDGSRDATGEIAERFASQDDRIAVIRQENCGQIMARSAGIAYALERCGDDAFFLFLDADDELKDGSLGRINTLLQENGCDMLFFSAETFDTQSGKTLGTLSGSAAGSVSTKSELYQIVLYDTGYNSLCRKALSKAIVGAVDYSAYSHLRYGEDLIQSLAYYKNAHTVYFTQEVFYRYHMNHASVTHQVDFYSYPIDATVRRLTWEFVTEEKVWSEEELNAYAQFLLDLLERKLISLSCFNVPYEEKAKVFDEVQQDEFYAMLLGMELRRGRIIKLLLKKRYRRLIHEAIIKKAVRHVFPIK